MDLRGIRGAVQGLAELAVAEHLRELGEPLQVGFVGLLGYQQHEQHVDRTPVGRVELHRGGQAQEGAGGVLEPLDAAVRDGDALAQPGRAEALAGEQAVEYGAAGDALVVLEQQAGLLEDALLAARVEIDNHVGKRQELGYQAHSQVGSRTLPSAAAKGAGIRSGACAAALRENARIITTPRTGELQAGLQASGTWCLSDSWLCSDCFCLYF